MKGEGRKGGRRGKEKVPSRPAKAGVRPADRTMWLGRTNLLIMGGGLLAILLGYLFLWLGSITIAPILLVLGYCFLIPLSLFWRPRASEAGSLEGPRAGGKPSGDPTGVG